MNRDATSRGLCCPLRVTNLIQYLRHNKVFEHRLERTKELLSEAALSRVEKMTLLYILITYKLQTKYYSLLPPILAYLRLTTLFIICLFPDLNSTSFPVIFSLIARPSSCEGTNVPISPLLTLYLGCFFEIKCP